MIPVSLRLAGVQGGDACAGPGVHAESLHLRNDLCSATGERLTHLGADSGDLGDAVPVDLVEYHAEPDNKFPAECRLEDRLGRVPLLVERLAVEGSATPVGAFGHVEHGPVEVNPWIAESAGAMEEDRTEEAPAWLLHCASVTAPHETGGLFEIALDFISGGIERLLDVARVVG